MKGKMADPVVDVIDDFLPSYQFKQLQSTILDIHFSWYYNDGIIDVMDRNFQFTHIFYNISLPPPWTSKYYPLFDLVQQKLGVRRLDRIKTNLNPKTVFHRKGGFHIDQRSISEGIPQHQNTAIFYVNTNNGWTEFKRGGKVKSIANRMVIFDSNLEHTGVSCTDEKRRVVINFNYDI